MRIGLSLGLGPGAALGLGRFAYALLLPSMQTALQLTLAQAGLIGSANTGGYLLGALISHRVLGAVGYRSGFYGAMIVQLMTLLLMGLDPSFAAMIALRFVQGIFGAFAFVSGAALLLASGGRSTALGVYFGGVGMGIALSVAILPLMNSWQSGWVWLGVLSALFTLVALTALPLLREPPAPVRGADASLRPIAAPMVAYALYGAGYIGYMTFVTSGLSTPIGRFWLVLGLATMLTGVTWGPLFERIGGAAGLRVVLLLLTISSLEPLLVRAPLVSAALFGITFVAVITAITQLFRQRLPSHAWPRAMALSTAAFASGQAVGPTLMGVSGDLFGGVGASLWASSAFLALAFVVALARAPRQRSSLS